MSDATNNPSPEPTGPQGNADAYSQPFQHSPVGARLPERVAAGVFGTGLLVLEGPDEFVLDFFQGLHRPPRVVARVVLSPSVMSQLVTALGENLRNYEQAFGPPKPLPTPGSRPRPTIEEIYQDLKLPDEMLSGVYANTVMIGHSPAEFALDFITRFYPHAAVTARVHLAASQMPQILSTLKTSLQTRLDRASQSRKKPPESN